MCFSICKLKNSETFNFQLSTFNCFRAGYGGRSMSAPTAGTAGRPGTGPYGGEPRTAESRPYGRACCPLPVALERRIRLPRPLVTGDWSLVTRPGGEPRTAESRPYGRACCLLPVACCLIRAWYDRRSMSVPTGGDDTTLARCRRRTRTGPVRPGGA